MGFNPGNSQRSNTAPTAQQDQSWKAQGFLNLYLPTPDGGRAKLGAIPLKESKPAERKLLDFLNEDPSRLAAIVAKLVVEYRPATPDDKAGFDLS